MVVNVFTLKPIVVMNAQSFWLANRTCHGAIFIGWEGVVDGTDTAIVGASYLCNLDMLAQLQLGQWQQQLVQLLLLLLLLTLLHFPETKLMDHP